MKESGLGHRREDLENKGEGGNGAPSLPRLLITFMVLGTGRVREEDALRDDDGDEAARITLDCEIGFFPRSRDGHHHYSVGDTMS